jgi:threonine dehydratase
MSEHVSVNDIAAAADALADVIVRTPLLPAPWLAGRVRGETRLKCENLQRAGAFKIRGAYTMVARLPAEARERGVIAFSSGNHAQGVALAAKLFDVPCVVVMPTTAPAVKVEGAKALGAEVILEGTTSIQRQRRAEQESATRGLAIIPAFDHTDIIAGQGTVGAEILEDWQQVEQILVPIGGGGLVSGIAAWVKARRSDVAVIGVEPETANAMALSVAAGEPVTIEPAKTIADGLMPVRPGDLTFAHCRDLVDDIVLVSDEQILEATRLLLSRAKLMVEFSGAATLAALLSGHVDQDRRTAVVLSGGNLDPVRALALMQSPQQEAVPA